MNKRKLHLFFWVDFSQNYSIETRKQGLKLYDYVVGVSRHCQWCEFSFVLDVSVLFLRF